MDRYVVRPTVSGQARMEGVTGGRSITIRAESAEQAKRLGADQLGVPAHTLEAYPLGDAADSIVVNMDPAAVAAALKGRPDQDTGIVDPRPR